MPCAALLALWLGGMTFLSDGMAERFHRFTCPDIRINLYQFVAILQRKKKHNNSLFS